MFILIVGGGKVGTYLARALLNEDHEVVVIEKDPKKAQMMANLLETDIGIVGDGCDPLVLENAGIARADVVIADTGDDEDNLVVSIISNRQARPARVIARVNNPRNKQIFESLDPKHPVKVISSTELILGLIDEEVNIHEATPMMTLRKGDLELVKLSVPNNSPANGKRVADIGLPKDSVIVAVERGDQDLVVPNGETMIQSGDAMIIMSKKGGRPQIRAALVGAG